MLIESVKRLISRIKNRLSRMTARPGVKYLLRHLELRRDKAETILLWGNTLRLSTSVRKQSLNPTTYIAPTDYRFLLAVEFDGRQTVRIKARQQHGMKIRTNKGNNI